MVIVSANLGCYCYTVAETSLKESCVRNIFTLIVKILDLSADIKESH